MQLFDTHCHIQEELMAFRGASGSRWQDAGADPDAQIADAKQQGVVGMLCVGTTIKNSQQAVKFVATRPEAWATIGVHPHEAAAEKTTDLAVLLAGGSTPRASSPPSARSSDSAPRTRLGPKGVPLGVGTDYGQGDWQTARADKIVAIGECGLDYFYAHSPKKDQIKVLRYQIELALAHDLPLIFHVREAFDDFWPVLNDYKNVRGVVHSFTDSQASLDKLLDLGLYVGVNGIVTFTKNAAQLAMYRAVPLPSLLLETDAPFLTPAPLRGKVNVPGNVRLVAEFLADLRGETPQNLAEVTTKNARRLFNL